MRSDEGNGTAASTTAPAEPSRDELIRVLEQLYQWHLFMGGFDAPVWDEAAHLIDLAHANSRKGV